MTKRKAIIKFGVICAVVALAIAAVFANFRIPFTSWKYVGLMGAIESKMGIDLKGGVMAVFNSETFEGKTPTTDEMKATETRLLNSLSAAGLTEATVQQQGSNKIRVEVPGLQETNEIFDAIGNPATLDFRDKNEETATPIVEAADIKKVQTYQNPETYEWGVLLTFTNEGGKKFRAMVTNEEINETYIFRNGKHYSTVTIQDRKAGSNNTTVITLGKENATEADAKDFKLQIESGLFSVKLVLAESSIIPQTLGPGALMGAMIALVIGLVFIFLFMFFRYGDLGLLSNLSLLVYICLFMFFLAIVNAVQLTLPGVAGIILALGMAVDANIIIFERIKDEYQTGKRMAVSIESGFNKSFWAIFDSNVTTIIGALVLFFLGTGPIKGFAITLILGVVVSMFCSLVVTRSFSKLYLYINSTNARRLKLENTNKFINEVNLNTVSIAAKPAKRALNMGVKE